MKRNRDQHCDESEGGTEKKARVSHVASVPAEILEHVFSFLDPAKDRLRVSLVCQTWGNVAWSAFDPSVRGNLAIRMASKHGRTEAVIRLLKDERVDPSVRCNDALCWASLNGHMEVVSLLLGDPRVDHLDTGHAAPRFIYPMISLIGSKECALELARAKGRGVWYAALCRIHRRE